MKNNYQHNFINGNIKKMYSLSSKALIIFFLLLTIISCSKNPVEPKEEPLPPGRRDYVWTVDTIKVPFFWISKIWGASPDNLWIIGRGGGLDQTIWHYDGIRWKTDGISKGIVPNGVWGFSRDNVWIAGNDGQIWHYNGIKWERNYHYVRDDYYAFQEIWGDAPDNIYALGFTETNGVRRASMLRYNGETWKELNVPNIPYSLTRIRKEVKETSQYFITGLGTNNNNLTQSILKFYEDKFEIIYESVYSQSTRSTLNDINQQVYFVIGNSIYLYFNNNFNLFLTNNDQNFDLGIYGRNHKDIFFNMVDGISHYNGDNTEYIYRFKKNIVIRNAMIFNDYVFFIANDFENNLNLVFKGVLQSENN